ncbi:DUF4198 domain-containing protein [Chitinasiproducens palmae]|uniref:DUF4198 domain-containing protein n=1 Tax=Chitinasiproducens palmae TaxID=1770053 RepID=A0A1H2PJG7_9BURK|nr:DUF4198 domain-containing protein [Chitinasiproducens palmae]SDV46478.1 protein of unknown function [Chitinasiproducens palmae]
MFKQLLFVSALCVASAANAHYVWLEPSSDGQAKAYFGEWQEDLRESASGHLGLLTTAHSVDGKGTLTPAKRVDDGFLAPVAAQADARLSSGFVGKDGTAYLYQARAGRTDTTARLTLELVPTEPNANTFTLMFDGKPLPKTKVTVFGPPKWEKSFYSDADGRVSIETPWPGQYVAEVSHADKARAGSWDGKAYQSARYVATLTFIKR